MLDHVFLTVNDLARSIGFYEAAVPKVGMIAMARMARPAIPTSRVLGTTEESSFGCVKARRHPVPCMSDFWRIPRQRSAPRMLKQWLPVQSKSTRPARSCTMTRAICAAQVCDPDGYSLEFVLKSWQVGR
jgi:predicted enzyme related to lactoylglutathione lyase